jgi:cytoskeletal protein CcmA (bactofilin family)
MFGKKNGRNPANVIESLIGPNTFIKGDIEFSGSLRIDGHVKGNITTAKDLDSTLVVAESGKIEGEVHATHVVLDGMIVGPVEVTDFLELQPKARIIGDVRYKQIEIHLGATIDGKLEHGDGEAKAPLRLATTNAQPAAVAAN